ncbi:hypothetical protein ANANG_G00223020 [Anguilla anguilla]|uniref:Uncharacterized protein n=1 Tax=Anguilla anguilla TaxID=7936 RepID=A0A9D3LXV0_ANGAN|nr:hypothetical protein ANANG_G00223020 [Anguilla anguilla]
MATFPMPVSSDEALFGTMSKFKMSVRSFLHCITLVNSFLRKPTCGNVIITGNCSPGFKGLHCIYFYLSQLSVL